METHHLAGLLGPCAPGAHSGNPTIKTFLAVLGAAGLQLAVTRPEQHA